MPNKVLVASSGSGIVNFDPESNQKVLLEHGFRCPNSDARLDAIWFPTDVQTTIGENNANAPMLSVIDGCGSLLIALADRDLDRAKKRWSNSPLDAPHSVLVMLAPALCWDAFASSQFPSTIPMRALGAVQRVVVLYCPGDITAQSRILGPKEGTDGRPCMASAGLAPGSDSRVSAIDISGLIEDRNNSARGALCSYEAMGLIVRLLKGVSPAAAVTPAAKIQSSN